MYFIFNYIKNNNWTGEMTQWLEVLTTKRDNLSSMPEAHMVENENLSM